MLRDHGFEPVVLTGPGVTRSRWMPVDEKLGDEIPHDMEVHRVSGPEPLPSSGRRASAERWLRIADPWRRWWQTGIQTAGHSIASETELLYVQMQPYDSAEAGAYLSRATGKPWVADLLDPWALDEM